MLEFVAGGHWLVVVPAPVAAECLAMGLMIFALRSGPIDHPWHREVHDHPNGVPEVAMLITFLRLWGAHVAGLKNPSELQAIARHLVLPLATRSSYSQA